MVSAPWHISNRKKKTIFPLFTLLVINSCALPPTKTVKFETQWNKCSNKNNSSHKSRHRHKSSHFLVIKFQILTLKICTTLNFYFSFWITYFCTISKPRYVLNGKFSIKMIFSFFSTLVHLQLRVQLNIVNFQVQ